MRYLSRTLTAGAFAAGCLLASAAFAQGTINYVTAGGAYLENIKKAYLEPVGKKMNVKFNVETSDVDTPVRVQVKSGVVTFDLVEFGADQCARGAVDGMYEKLDFSVIDKTDLLPGSYSDYYVGSTIYAIVPAWNTKKFGENGPQNWADVWNVEKFPGSRSFTKHPRYTLEAALLADGVTPDKLYPMDLNRAFASLKKIKPHVKVWWESGAQSTQLMKDGVVDISSMFNARAESAIAAGGPVAYTFNQGIMNAGCWAVVKGAPNKALAMKVLSEFVKPEYQAQMTILSNYGYSNSKAGSLGIIPPETTKKLPTSDENIKKTVWMNFDCVGEERRRGGRTLRAVLDQQLSLRGGVAPRRARRRYSGRERGPRHASTADRRHNRRTTRVGGHLSTGGIPSPPEKRVRGNGALRGRHAVRLLPANIVYLTGYDSRWFRRSTPTGLAIRARDARAALLRRRQPSLSGQPRAGAHRQERVLSRFRDTVRDGWIYRNTVDDIADTLKAKGWQRGTTAVEHWALAPAGLVLRLLETHMAEAGAKTVDGSWIVDRVRLVKSAREIALIEKAAEIADGAFRALQPVLKAGMTETEIQGFLNYEMSKRGGEEPAIRTGVASGFAHPLPPHRPDAAQGGKGRFDPHRHLRLHPALSLLRAAHLRGGGAGSALGRVRG